MKSNIKTSYGQREVVTGGKQYNDNTTVINCLEGNIAQLTTTVSSTVDINMPDDFTEMWDATTNKLVQ